MAHWSDKYVGMRVIPGKFDCANLVELIQQEVFGKKITLPTDQARSVEGTLSKFRARSNQVMSSKDDFAVKTLNPRDGDAVLLQTRGYKQHIGTLCFINNDVWVLHADDRAGQVVRVRARELPIRNYMIEGYYRWK